MNLTKEELNDIIQGCAKRKRKSQQEFFKYFYGKMKAICKRYARDGDEAEDIVQEGFIKVFENLYRYEVTGSIEGWVRRIFVNTAIDHYRKNKNKFNGTFLIVKFNDWPNRKIKVCIVHPLLT